MKNGYLTPLILLVTLYMFFVIGDIATTGWLIVFDPRGIGGEGNPLAASIYMSWGVVGLFVAKFLVFLPMSFLYFYASLKGSEKVREAAEYVMLGLIGYSILIIYSNLIAVGLVSYIRSLYGVYIFLFKSFLLSFVLIVVGLVAYYVLKQSVLRAFEAVIGVFVIIAPIYYFDRAFVAILRVSPLLFFVYIFIMFFLLIIGIYIVERLIRSLRSY